MIFLNYYIEIPLMLTRLYKSPTFSDFWTPILNQDPDLAQWYDINDDLFLKGLNLP